MASGSSAQSRAAHCFHAIINRDNLKIYIGSAVRFNHRWNEHRCSLEKRSHGNRYLQKAFIKNPNSFELQVVEELPNADKSTLLNREQFWIDFYKSYLPDKGYNIAPKADSCQGIVRDEELKARISATLKGRKFSPERLAIHRNRKKPTKFRTFTPEQRAEQSRRLAGRKLPKQWCENISKALATNPYQKRAVLQFSMDGRFIRQFDQVKHAEDALGFRTNIHAACNGKRRSAAGFVWRYASSSVGNQIMVPLRKWRGRKIIQLSMAGNVIKHFVSLKAAGRAVGVSDSAIRQACSGRSPTSAGYKWTYA